MKKIFTVLVLCCMLTTLSAQWGTIVDVDTCELESSCEYLFLNNDSLSLWQLGTPTKSFFGAAYSPPNAIMTDTVNTYTPNNQSYFDFKIPNTYGFDMIVTFKHKYQTDSLIDGGYIAITYDKGSTWYNVINDPYAIEALELQNFYTQTDSLHIDSVGFSGTSDGWQESSIKWIWTYPVAKTIIPDTVWLRFHFVSDSLDTQKDGWMIDDIKISYEDLGGNTSKIEVPELTVQPNPIHSSGILTIPSELVNQTLEFRVYNSVGQVVQHEFFVNKNNLEITTFEKGLYYFQLLSERQVVGKGKFLKL